MRTVFVVENSVMAPTACAPSGTHPASATSASGDPDRPRAAGSTSATAESATVT